MPGHARHGWSFSRGIGSFGGLLTYWLAANYPGRRVERCVVFDAPADVDSGVVEQIGPSLARLGQVYGSWDEYLAFVRAMPYFDEAGWSSELEQWYRADVRLLADYTVQARPRPEHIQSAVEGTLEVDWPATVARIVQPTLLMRAPGSFGPPGSAPILTREDAERTLALLPAGELVEGVGHHMTFMFGAGARLLVQHIARFLSQVPASR